MPRTTTAAAIAAASLLSLALVGCTTSSEGDLAVDPSAPTSAEPEAPADPTDPGCLVGDWVIAQSEMQKFYDAVSGSTEGLSLTIEGDTGLSFTTDTFTYTPDFTLVLEIAGVAGEGVTTGSLSGGWTAADGIVTTTVGANDIDVQVSIAGTEVDASDSVGGIIASDPINQAPFDCSDPAAPVLQFDTGTESRVPLALSPRG